MMPSFSGPQAENKSFTGQIAIVLDILRATSTIVTALGNNASQVVPVAEPETTLQLKRNFGAGHCIIRGEREGYKIPGFNLGNSPAEYTEANISGKTVFLSTTNGTRTTLTAERTGKSSSDRF